MKGTEKQIKWAQDIKASMAMNEAKLAAKLETLAADKMSKLVAALDGGKLGENPIATLLDRWNAIADSKQDASWWIENRRRNDIGGAMLAQTADAIITNELIDNL